MIDWIVANKEWLGIIIDFTVALGTIFLAIVSYLQVRASHKLISESRFQSRIDKHNIELKNMFKTWIDRLEEPPKTGHHIYNKNLILSLLQIENINYNLFLDSMTHLPAKHIDLEIKWNNYKILYDRYIEKQDEIISKINSEQQQKSSVIFPPESIYIRAIQLLNSNKYYRYEKNPATNNEIYYKSDDYPGWEITHAVSKNMPYITNNQGSHEKAAFFTKQEYEIDIKSIISIEIELNDWFKELKDRLEDLTNYAEYSNMNCEYVKIK